MKLFRKILSFITVFLLLFYQVYFPLAVLAQEATSSASEEQVAEPTPESSPSPSETPIPTPEPPPTPTPIPSEKSSVWQENPDGSVTTTEPVSLNKTYEAPQNSKVTVTFNKLTNPGTLTIMQIILSQEDMEDLGAVSEVAFDIISTMENGTFEYTLTLPTPTTENVEVKASEDGETFVTLGGVTAQQDTLTITGLNHFTIFLISSDTTGGSYTATTGPSIVESANKELTTGTIILNAPSGFIFNTGVTVDTTISSTNGNTDCFTFSSTSATSGAGTLTSTTITFTVSAQDGNGGNPKAICQVVFSSIQIRPTDGTPLASGDITRSGTSTGGTFNANTYTEIAGDVSASQSTVSASSSSVAADGTTTSTITVTLKDQFGNPVSGKTVSLSSSRGSTDTISAASGASDSSGVVTFTVKSSTLGSSTYTATDSTDSVQITQTASVTFNDVTAPSTPGTPSTATPTNDTTPSWTWTASTDNVAVDYYIFYWGTTAGSETNNSGNIGVGTTSFTHSSTLAAGTWYGKVKAFDAAGNSSTSTNGSVVVDTTAPTGSIFINDGAAYTNTTSVDLSFAPSKTISQIELRNGTTGSFQNPVAYESPHAYTLLSGDGSKTVAVRFTDSAGNKSAGAINDSIILDTTSPTDPTAVSTSHEVSVPSANDTIQMSLAGASDALSGVDGFAYEFNNDPGWICDEATDLAGDTTSVSETLFEGEWYFHLCTVDGAGNWTSTIHEGPFIIDLTAPEATSLTIDPIDFDISYITGTVTVSANVSDSSGVGSVDFKIYDYWGGFGDEDFCSGVQDSEDATLWSCQINTASLSEDPSYDMQVTATDSAGNSQSYSYVDDEGNSEFYVDNTPPSDPSSVSSPSHTVNSSSSDTTIDIEWASDADDYASGVDGFSYSFTQGPTDIPNTTKDAEEGTSSTTSTALTEGSWYFHLRTVDNVGIWTSTVHLGPFIIDTTSPTVTLNTPLSGTTSPTFVPVTGTTNENATCTYSLDGGVNTAMDSTGGTVHTKSLSDLATGTHNVRLSCTDNAGNSVVSSLTTWTVFQSSGSTLIGSGSNVIFSSATDGQADLPNGITTLTLSNTTNFDVSAGLNDVFGNNITIGGVVLDLSSFTSGNLVGQDLSGLQNIGGISFEIEKAVALQSGTNGEPILLTNSDLSGVNVFLPDGVSVLAPNGWGGTIQPPKTGSSSGTAPSGFSIGNTVIEVGSSDLVLLFDSPVTVLLTGVTGPVGYKSAGSTTWIQITNVCGGTYASPASPTFPGECAISNGTDTKIVTYHFTSFAALNTVSSTSSSSTQALSSGGGGGTPPVCNDAKPGSAPTLISAVADTNSVTLNWNKALNPVTYYLATYGLSAGTQQYGNPNIGGPDTTTYTVSGLSGTATYYFKVRAGNGCAPGDFSNELSATPGGGFVEDPATGFAPGVLGTAIDLENVGVGAENTQISTTPKPQETETSPFDAKVLLIVVVALLFGFGVFKLIVK